MPHGPSVPLQGQPSGGQGAIPLSPPAPRTSETDREAGPKQMRGRTEGTQQLLVSSVAGSPKSCLFSRATCDWEGARAAKTQKRPRHPLPGRRARPGRFAEDGFHEVGRPCAV